MDDTNKSIIILINMIGNLINKGNLTKEETLLYNQLIQTLKMYYKYMEAVFRKSLEDLERGHSGCEK